MVPSTRAFLDLALRGLAWQMQPANLAAPHLACGSLVELSPDTPIDVTLYWTVARLHADALRHLIQSVKCAAGAALVL